MADAWVRFASTGDPNGGTLPHGPAYDGGSDPYLEFGYRYRVTWIVDELLFIRNEQQELRQQWLRTAAQTHLSWTKGRD